MSGLIEKLTRAVDRVISAIGFVCGTTAAHLVAIVLITVVPLNLVIAAIIWHLAGTSLEAQRASLLFTARSIAAGIDARLDKYMALAKALASSPALLADDLGAFEIEARRITGAWILVADLDGHMLLNNARQPSEPLPRRDPLAIATQKRAFETRSIIVSDVWLGQVTQDWVAVVEVPIFRDGQPFRALAVTVSMQPFLDMLNEEETPKDWLTGIIDREGRFIARVPDNEHNVGQLASRGWRAIKDQEGLFEFASIEGDHVVVANTRSAISGWSIGVAVKKAELTAAAWGAARWAVLLGGSISLASLFFAAILARRITRPIAQLRDNVGALLEGKVIPVLPGPPEIGELQKVLRRAAVERRRSQAALAASEERQAFLLKLSDALRPITDPDEVLAVASRMLGEHLGVSRVAYADIEGDEFVIRQCYAKGVAPFVGRGQIAAYGEKLLETYRRGEMIAVNDVAADPSFTAAEQANFRAAKVAAFAGFMLTKSDRCIGGFGVHNTTPRVWTQAELDLIGEVAQRIWAAAEWARAETLLRESEDRLATALRAGKLGVYECDPGTGQIKWDAAMYQLWGVPETEPVTCELFESGVHPEDLEGVRATTEQARDPRGTRHHTAQYRVVSRADGTVRWLLAESETTFEHGAPRRIVGIVQDITDRRRAEHKIQLLLREVNHRVNNMLSLVQAIARQTAASTPQEFMARFTERLRALSANQGLLIRNEWQGIAVEPLVRAQLAHFADLVGTRIKVAGPDVWLTAAAAQAIGMSLHELATNAGKYGALSNAEGYVEIAWRQDDGEFSISWTERGGPPVKAPERRGFGSTVISSIARTSVSGEVELDFAASGMAWRLRCPANIALAGQIEDVQTRADAASRM